MKPFIHPDFWSLRRRALGRSRGFTLLEMMASLVLMAIFAQLVGAFTGWQLSQYVSTSSTFGLDDVARGITSLLRDDYHNAGWGQAIDPNAYGWIPTGKCLPLNADEVDKLSEENCTGRDENGLSDRSRISYGTDTDWYVPAASNPSNGPCLGSSTTVPVRNNNGPSTLMLSANDLVFTHSNTSINWKCVYISGFCVDGSDAPAANLTFCLDGSDVYQQNNLGCAYTLFGNYEPEYTASPSIGCTNGWKPGWMLTSMNSVNYYVQPNTTTGNFDLWRWDNYGGKMIAVNNISHFQISYALDLSVPMDGKLDDCPSCTDDPYPTLFSTPASWCRDLNNMCGLSLSDGSQLTKSTIYNRIIGVHISFRIFDTDPTQFKTYQATIALKNRMTQ